jgi:hypothetical protein
MGGTGEDPTELSFAIEGRRRGLADPLGMEGHAPTATKDAVVSPYQCLERGPGGGVERLDLVRFCDHAVHANPVTWPTIVARCHSPGGAGRS